MIDNHALETNLRTNTELVQLKRASSYEARDLFLLFKYLFEVTAQVSFSLVPRKPTCRQSLDPHSVRVLLSCSHVLATLSAGFAVLGEQRNRTWAAHSPSYSLQQRWSRHATEGVVN
jgi:hypothetical protein